MPERLVLVVDEDADVGRGVRWAAVVPGADRVCRLLDAEDAVEVVHGQDFRVVVYLETGRDDLAALARLLWATSTTARPAPVVVVSERYDPGAALVYIRMGVTDYLSVAEQGDALARVLGRFCDATAADAPAAVPTPRPEAPGPVPPTSAQTGNAPRGTAAAVGF